MAKKPKKKVEFKAMEALREELQLAPTPRPEKIASEFIRQIGGETHFAGELVKEYQAAKTGSLQRQRIMQMILICASRKHDDYDPTALDRMDEDELKQLLTEHFKEIGALDGGDETIQDSANEGKAAGETGGPAKAEDGTETRGGPEADEEEASEAGAGDDGLPAWFSSGP